VDTYYIDLGSEQMSKTHIDLIKEIKKAIYSTHELTEKDVTDKFDAEVTIVSMEILEKVTNYHRKQVIDALSD
jgi:hypothetical protein